MRDQSGESGYGEGDCCCTMESRLCIVRSKDGGTVSGLFPLRLKEIFLGNDIEVYKILGTHIMDPNIMINFLLRVLRMQHFVVSTVQTESKS